MMHRGNKRRFALALACAFMLAMCAQALADQAVTAYTKSDDVAVYDAVGKALGSLPANTKLTVTGVKGDICRVEKGGRTAYIMKSNLSAAPVAPADPDGEGEKAPAGKSVTAYVARDGAKVYNAGGKPVGSLDLNTKVTVTGLKGKVCRVEKDGRTAYMRKADLSTQKISTGDQTPGSTLKPAKGTCVEMDWWTSGIQQIFARGVVAQITDVETGLTWREKRTGGTNHADCQPLTAADTAAMKKAYGGKWSWDRRAVFVTIDGVNYAASINGMPHGGDSIADNAFDGHHCIHFTNSRTHGSNRVCPKHQAAIRTALLSTL